MMATKTAGLGPQDDGRANLPMPDIKPTLTDTLKPEDIRQRILSGETAFGRLIKPLVEELVKLPAQMQAENIESFRIIFDSLKGRTIPKMELTREDILFMITDPAGNLIRRPILSLLIAERLDEELTAQGPAEQRVKDLLIKPMKASSWSRFVNKPEAVTQIRQEYPGEEVYVDQKQIAYDFRAAIKECPTTSGLMVRKANEVAVSWMKDNVKKVDGDFKQLMNIPFADRKVKFITDPDHAFNQHMDLKFAMFYVDADLGMGDTLKLPPLVREATFMLVEDNPLHAMMVDVLGTAKGLQRYSPAREVEDPLIREAEARGHYSSAERALEVIEGNIGGGGKPPDVILADIELLGEMNGIRFVKEVHRRETAAGRNPVILMLWSSNPRMYRDEIDGLVRSGVVAGSWNKKDARPEEIIGTINNELMKRA
jgi:CheY-like chemotaxis protein